MTRPGPLMFILGPCVLESPEAALATATRVSELGRALACRVVFKASFDKANRTDGASFRGPGLRAGLEMLAAVKVATGLEICTDIHEAWQAEVVAPVADILQIPAFLCRQTDLVVAAGRSGRVVNIKKAQHLDPRAMGFAADKARQAGASAVWLTERGSSFGPQDLVVDMRALVTLGEIAAAHGGCVIYDATHAVQRPGGGSQTGGSRRFVLPLARAAVAVGVDGIFAEVHPAPARAPCDAEVQWPLAELEGLMRSLLALQRWRLGGGGPDELPQV